MDYKQLIDQHIENGIANLRPVFEAAAKRLMDLNPDGSNKITGTKLAAELGDEFGVAGPALYPILKKYLFNGFPGVAFTAGAQGGGRRIPGYNCNAVLIKELPEIVETTDTDCF